MDTSVLTARGLSQHFGQGNGQFTLFESLDFALYPAEQVAIVGRSGSGKTTLLNLLAGLSLPSQGQVELCGQPYPVGASARDHWRAGRLGMVFQFHHLLAEFTAQENVALGLRLAGHRSSDAMRIASQWLDRVGLGHRLSHAPSQLSGGERQRVAIARALAPAPPVVLMDEPTGNLDGETADQIQQMLSELVREAQLALVIVTHDLQLAQQTDRQLTLTGGKLA
ncbi:MAG: ABC transporter ATP-binding protein [Litorivicinus sp.]